MSYEVSPKLRNQISEYLQQRERGETSLLSFYYREVFGRELKINCGGCIEDAVRFLKQILIIKKSPMEKFKWSGGKLKVHVRIAGTLTTIAEDTCTDTLAEMVYSMPNYSHLVEPINGGVKLPKLQAEPEKSGSEKSEPIILTSKEVLNVEEVVKKKRGRPFSK